MNDRSKITAEVVDQIERLLAVETADADIAKRLRVSPYVVGVIAGDKHRRERRSPPQVVEKQTCNRFHGIDAATIRMIQRMLSVNIISRRQMAIETGVSEGLISKIATGKRLAISSQRPFVFKDLGERFLERPIRCRQCGAMISITPCRACRALRS